MSFYANVIKIIFTLTTSKLSNGLNTLKGSSVQLVCPYTTTNGGNLDWRYENGSFSVTYSINSQINPSFPPELRKRLNITGNHSNGEYHLNISDVRESDEGTYECTVFLKVDTQILTVFVEPSSVNIENVSLEDKLQGTEGLDLKIACRAEGGKPLPDVKLMISGVTFATGKQSIQHTLPAVNRSMDRKTITCQAGYEEFLYYPHVDSANLYLNLMPIQPVFIQESVNTEETVPLNVSCISYGSRPAASFTWLIGQNNSNVTFNSTETTTFNSSTETFTVTSRLIYGVDRTYNGQIVTCVASNIVSTNVSSSKLLNIKYAPNVRLENKTFLQTEKERNLQCHAQGNPSEYTYFKCYHKSFYDVVIRELNIGQNGILSLPVVFTEYVYQDSGIYLCTVGNGIRDKNGQEKQLGYGFVRINAQPVFAKTNVQKMNGVIGRRVDVNVYVFSEPKYTTIKWYKNTTLLKKSAKYSMTENMMIIKDDFYGREVQLDGYKLTLVINELRFEDASVYKLQLSNGIGNLVEHNLILEIGNIPQRPTNITVVSIGEASLTIQWDHVDDKELHLMYHIEYKLSISPTWIHKELITKETDNKKLLYLLAGLQTSTYYDVRILAENSFNKSLPSTVITAQTLDKGNQANAIQSTAIPIVALGTSSTIITIVAWLIVGLFWFKRKTIIKTKRNITDSTQHRSDIQMYDVVTDSARIQTDQPRDISDTSMAAYEALGLKDKPNAYSEF